MAKAAKKTSHKKPRPKSAKAPARKARKPAMKKPVPKKAKGRAAPKKTAVKAMRKKAALARKKTAVRKSVPARKPPVQKKASAKPEAPKKERAAMPQRQLLIVEEKKPPMVAPSAQLPANAAQSAPSAPVPPVQPARQAAQPQVPPHIDASRHDDGPLAIPLTPALDMLPEWEDRLRLRRAIFEDGLAFFSLSRGSPEYHEALIALSKSGKDAHEENPGYFIVCLKDRSGAIVGAMDGHMLDNAVMCIGRSFVRSEKRREMHILLYSAALSGHQPEFIFFSGAKTALSIDSAARLILLGRGFGFSALPIQKPGVLYFIRRVKRELDPISSGQELSRALSGAKALLGVEKESAELGAKGVVPLITLPTSPDSREHLHELRDVVLALGIAAPDLETVLETLRAEYILQRKDLTPELLF